METKHTPGNWNAIQERHFWVVEDSEGQRLASLLESECVFTDGIEHDDAAANAKLMATAPDLLADLVVAAETLRRYEVLHRAKCTAESLEKAEVNAGLAHRFEQTIAKATA
ncbi:MULTISPECIES: hypothetical protein [unclassified Pseudomonas]|jgi:hypothetical protein|uniref:hypothetical protein n=1 Tax=unclassified Pseudomonas TaxID=196821 RepID=UPI000C88E596|nr:MULTISPECIES: hypothetical protein [unclassified Pseudomonas]MBL1311242.1 hypothetical protein [Pseudomonas sp.]PMX19128.1 hypothetical protein C1Y25_00560 [Pseudomonas sp. MPBC4-3]PMX50089.1 hypothetical protein C1Y20_04275 [Pseudomonas sp. FW301-21B01]PMY10805.1 hypothetical protein C1Y18_02105 [Pseudomonas sp. MPR-R5A]PNA72972.1 hypothetical protein C1Y14_01660 [Pseudomonas sp. MPR-R5B]